MFLPGSFLAERLAMEHRQDMLRQAELDRLLRGARPLRRSRLACGFGRLLRRFGCQLVALGTRLGQRELLGRQPAQGALCNEVPARCVQ